MRCSSSTNSIMLALALLSGGCAAQTLTTPRHDGGGGEGGALDGSSGDMGAQAPGVSVAPTVGLFTSEAGMTASFQVVLLAPPSANVTIAVSSSDVTEGSVAPASLTFTPLNWNAPQTVTVTGVDDTDSDGLQQFTVVTAPCVSTDIVYNGTNPVDVTVSNIDNETAGVSLSRTSGLLTTEAGGTDSFTVTLNNAPTADVTITFSSSVPTEATVSPPSITFTPANCSSPQTVTVTGVDDSVADGDRAFSIVTARSTSTDSHYSNLDVPDVAGTNRDDETAGINVDVATTLVTTEAGGVAMFSIVLQSEPMSDVTIPLSSTDTSEGTVTAVPLTFTPTNWNVPQAVLVTGVNDSVADGDQPYRVLVGPASSSDSEYSGLSGPDVAASNTDDESAGFEVSPMTGLVTSEGATTASFTVVLRSEPLSSVALSVTSSDTTEGTVAPATLSFSTSNWNTPQTVTVTGVNDAVADGDQSYFVVVHVTTSGDAAYAALADQRATLTNTDNETPGITVTPITGLMTTEAGGTATFTIALNSEPTFDVSVSVSSDVPLEGSASPSLLTFTALNWNTQQTVTVTGLDDLTADGNRVYHIITAAATSTDPTYNGRDAADVTVTNLDNDVVGVTVTPTTGLSTSEAGATTTFTVRLTSQPTASVTINLASSDATEGTMSPASLSFSMSNWNMAQTVTVTGVDDLIADGNVVYSVVTAAVTSGDTTYNGVNPTDVTLSNIDNDMAGVVVAPTSGLVTTEAGGTATFTVVLTSQPTANVVVSLSSSNAAEGTVAPSATTFTSANWNVAQTVTVTGVNDFVVDGTVAYTIVTSNAGSSDAVYNNLVVADVSVSNTDNDTAGISVTPTAGLVTSEAGGTASFTVVLSSQPTASVTINMTSSNAAEGTVSPASLVFTTANWNAARTVTVTGVNDSVADGNIAYTIVTAAAVSTDANYSARNPSDVSVTNNDNDAPGVTVSPTAGLMTTEASGTATFSIVLASQPTANVTISLMSSNTAEGTVSPASVTFTSANWSSAQTVTVTGVNDAVADGSVAYAIVTGACVSTDAGYSGRVVADVSVTNLDNDVAGITVTPTSGLVTSEAGTTATFSVVLTSQPTANVTIALSSSDTTEGTVSPASLAFTSANWATARTVTVTGVNDFIVDGSVAYVVVTGAAVSTDPGYSARAVTDVTVTNTDNDALGVTVTPSSGLVTSESGSSASFTMVLTSQPTASVTFGLSSTNTAEGIVSPSSVTFTTASWNVAQTIAVVGQNDSVADGAKMYTIVTAAGVSADAAYNGFNPADVAVTNNDNDTVGVTVTPTSGLQTQEYLRVATFTMVLTSQPTASVSVSVSSSNAAEGTVSPTSLTFTTTSWNVPQTIVVSGVDDAVVDGSIAYTVVTAPCVSSDTGYNGFNPSDVSVTNLDNDRGFVLWKASSALGTTESGAQATFAVKLSQAPTANVSMTVTSGDTTEASVSPGSLTFTSANWSTPQTVTVTGIADAISDGTQYYNVVLGTLSSADTGFNGVAATNVPLVTCDGSGTAFAVCLAQTRALSFVADDRVTVPDATALNFGSGDFTVEAWVQFATTQSQRFPTIASKRSTSGNGFLFYVCRDGCAGQPQPRVQMGGVNYSFFGRFWDATNIFDATWHHLAVSRVSGVIDLYLDGVSTGSYGATADVSSVGGPLFFGRETVNLTQSNLDGRMHSARVFGTGRTAAQIRTDMWTAAPAGMAGGWRFNDGSGDTAAASAGPAGYLGVTMGAVDASDPTWITPP
ncbi:MAG: hypothetical protein IPK60_08395 [Sandaracinaceae bacterium]|nr:hypothetical protein [Sandaracinaceae bacterium]